MGPYKYRLTCPDCTGVDPLGCFDGGYQDSDETFVTIEQAVDAGCKAIQHCIYEFSVIDAKGRVVVTEDGQMVPLKEHPSEQ